MSERAARERSRSPRKHRSDRSPERRSKHSKSHRHRDVDDEDRQHKHRRDRDREETEEERKDRKRQKKEKRREDRKDREKLGVVDDDDDAGMWVEKGADTDVSGSPPTMFQIVALSDSLYRPLLLVSLPPLVFH